MDRSFIKSTIEVFQFSSWPALSFKASNTALTSTVGIVGAGAPCAFAGAAACEGF